MRKISKYWLSSRDCNPGPFLADRTNGCVYATVFRPSVCMSLSSVTLCIVAKRCVLDKKLLLTADRKSHIVTHSLTSRPSSMTVGDCR